MGPMPVMTQPPTFERSFHLGLDHALKAAALSSVGASKASTASLSTMPCNTSSIQFSLLNGFPPQPRTIFSKPLGLMDFPLMQKPIDNEASIMSALINSTRPFEMKQLNSCGQQLQLAIRNAVNGCLSGLKPNVSLQGNLTISVDSGEQVSVCFNDQQRRFPENMPPAPIKVEQNQTPSKRKAYHPIRHYPVNVSPTSSSSSSPPLNIPISEYATQPSGSASPCTTDSGALDLSRAGSLNGSAPITPLKTLSVHDPMACHHFPILPQPNILDVYSNPFLRNMSFPELALPYQQQQPHVKSPMKVSRKRPCIPRENRVSPIVRRSNASRKFSCNQCREEFTSLHSLEDHTISKHGTYRCHICRAQFTQRSNLQRHALKHVGFKPFECRVCRKAYYRKDHLMRHMEMGHPGYSPRENITVHLTSSESLDYLSRNPNEAGETNVSEEFLIAYEEEMKKNEDSGRLDVSSTDDDAPLEIACIDINSSSRLVESSNTEDTSDEPVVEMVESEESQPSEKPNNEL